MAREDGATARHFFASFQQRDDCHAALRKMWAEHKSGARAQPGATAAAPAAAIARHAPEPEPEPEQQLAGAPSTASPEATAAAAAAASEQEEVDIMLVADENQVRSPALCSLSFRPTFCHVLCSLLVQTRAGRRSR